MRAGVQPGDMQVLPAWPRDQDRLAVQRHPPAIDRIVKTQRDRTALEPGRGVKTRPFMAMTARDRACRAASGHPCRQRLQVRLRWLQPRQEIRLP